MVSISEHLCISDFENLLTYNGEPTTYVISESAGIGKTTSVTTWLNENPEIKAVILSESHYTLSEVERMLRSDETNHWYGHSHLCLIDELKGLPPDIACRLCKRYRLRMKNTKCPYKAQFRKKKRITLAPLEYSETKKLRELEIDLVWVEESPFKVREFKKPNKEIIAKHSEIVGKVLTERDYIIEYEKIEQNILSIIEQKESAEEAIKLAKELFNPRPCEIAHYFLFKTCKIPYLYRIFEIARNQEANILITDATFSDFVYDKIAKRFGGFKKRRLALNSTNKQISNSIVFKIGEGWYPRETLKDVNVQRRIAKDIVKIAFVNRLKVVPIITFKGFDEKMRKSIKEILEDRNYDCEIESLTFGNLRTSNKFAEYPIGFVIGSYNIGKNNLKKEAEGLIELTDFTVEKIKGRYVFKNPETREFQKFIEDSEQYQAIHRFRPLRKPTKVFVWGYIPDQIKHEVKVVKLGKAKDYVNKEKARRRPKKLDLNEGIRKAKEYIENVPYKKVAKSELKNYLINKEGYSINSASEIIKQIENDPDYGIYKVKTGKRPKEYICKKISKD